MFLSENLDRGVENPLVGSSRQSDGFHRLPSLLDGKACFLPFPVCLASPFVFHSPIFHTLVHGEQTPGSQSAPSPVCQQLLHVLSDGAFTTAVAQMFSCCFLRCSVALQVIENNLGWHQQLAQTCRIFMKVKILNFWYLLKSSLVLLCS